MTDIRVETRIVRNGNVIVNGCRYSCKELRELSTTQGGSKIPLFVYVSFVVTPRSAITSVRVFIKGKSHELRKIASKKYKYNGLRQVPHA